MSRMISQTLLILLLSFLFCFSCTQGKKIDQEQASLLYSSSDLHYYLDKWERRDGIAGAIISNYFLDYVGSDAPLFFSIMAKNENTYHEWVELLPTRSFTDYGGCMNRDYLECKRTGLIDYLSLLQLNERHSTLNIVLINKLKDTQVRAVD